MVNAVTLPQNAFSTQLTGYNLAFANGNNNTVLGGIGNGLNLAYADGNYNNVLGGIGDGLNIGYANGDYNNIIGGIGDGINIGYADGNYNTVLGGIGNGINIAGANGDNNTVIGGVNPIVTTETPTTDTTTTTTDTEDTSAPALPESEDPDFESMSDSELQEYFDENHDYSGSGKEIHHRNAEGDTDVHDPYEVDINGEKYIFTQDKNGNGKIDGTEEILGNADTKDNLFAGMEELDANNDGKVSASELQAAGVSLQKVEDGKLTDSEYDLANVDGIDLNSFEATNNKEATGTFGTFGLTLKDGTTTQGKETFEDDNFFAKLLAK